MYLNQLLRLIAEHGWGQLFYNVFFAGGFVAVFIYSAIGCKNYKIPRKKAMLTIFLVYTIAVIWMFTQCWIENGFKNWGGNNIVRTFVWIPLVALLVSRLMKIDWLKCCDFVAPCVPMVQAVSHWGCIFVGCCHGYPCEWGIYNPAYQERQFPTQPLEALTALAIVMIVLQYEKKHDYRADGRAYSLMLMLFGYSRFLLEFLRNNHKIFMGLSSLSLHALFMALVGTAAYTTLSEHARKKIVRR